MSVWLAIGFVVVISLAVLELSRRGQFILLLIREFVRFIILVELGAMRVVRWVYPSKFVLTGRCQKRALRSRRSR